MVSRSKGSADPAEDIAGPMARTVTDAVAVFQLVAGYDPNDAVTEASRTRTVPDYAKALRRDGLKGARIGIPRAFFIEKVTPPGEKNTRGGLNPEQLAAMNDAANRDRIAAELKQYTAAMPDADAIVAKIRGRITG